MSDFDAAVVGAGPNGLAAAVELARSGRRVLVVEGSDRIGGGARTEELTLPGFLHDVCSAIHPTGVASPFFEEIGLPVEWVQPPIPFTHPLDGGRVVALHRSVERTAAELGEDRESYLRLLGPLLTTMDQVVETAMSPVSINPRHKSAFARLAFNGGMPAVVLARRFRSEEARALIAGLAAHSIAPFGAPATSAIPIFFAALGHHRGWPLARGGSRAITDALAEMLEGLGGSVEIGRTVEKIEDLPGDLALLDVMPPAALHIGGSRLSPGARRRLRRWSPGPGVFKVDWALSETIPWADPLSRDAASVHLGGSYQEVAAAERAVSRGEHPERPFLLLAQQSNFDDTRAPEGRHTAWAYCHVPNGSQVDMTEAIEAQVERFAPGFREVILARAARNTMQYQAHNPNMVGGDIGGGRFGLRKVLQVGQRRPYALGGSTYLCSSATPPGAGVHGMCGYHAARAALTVDHSDQQDLPDPV